MFEVMGVLMILMFIATLHKVREPSPIRLVTLRNVPASFPAAAAAAAAAPPPDLLVLLLLLLLLLHMHLFPILPDAP